ncbi:MAG TPA: phosphoribosylformylglycinamidine cyclo-ligase [bacterium]|nr:phosphoribosylformylglycinamidine cyclo-ligase [bacterium]
MDYKSAGVDIRAGEQAVERIKSMVRTTFTPEVLTDLGKFGGFFEFPAGLKNPVLVSSIDGVGTKLKIAFLMKHHDTIGEDLVNHCINDILAGGAFPLFFLDYIGTGKLHPHVMEAIIRGMVKGCREAGCALIGGEMAEMPGFYAQGEYDVAGCIVGVVERDRIVDGSDIQPGDTMIGLPSTGLHTNGYSLARKVLFEKAGYTVDTLLPELDLPLGESLLKVHRCYLRPVRDILNKYRIKGMSHITGGGITGNTRRILPRGLGLDITWDWPVPPLFEIIQSAGGISRREMRKAFNMGIGYILVVEPRTAETVMDELRGMGEKPVCIGKVVRR